MDQILKEPHKNPLLHIGAPLLLISLLSMIIFPLSPTLLDVLFTFNIVFSLIIILATIYCKRPLDFAVFPTIILVATLLRLALNIASTRIVLLNGHTGTDAAGEVIKSFGDVVIGGNYTVGLVIFLILVVINFVVITKGAGRISEVSARFTLDSLPGKQMAIDAELNAGMITQAEAKQRREELVAESDFYGSMDGASKFVRGDAVACIVILLINIVGGLIIGVSEHSMSLADAGHNYILLTIGDGLAAQIPALLLSTAAAIMVTRFSKSHDVGQAFVSQALSNKRSLWVVSLILFILGVIPEMPNGVFLSFAFLMAGAAFFLKDKQATILQAENTKLQPIRDTNEKSTFKDLTLDDVFSMEPITVEVGYRLIPLVNSAKQINLLESINDVRRKLSEKYGFLIPKARIKDNLQLPSSTYQISIDGVILCKQTVYLDKLLAVNPGNVNESLPGEQTIEPICGLNAYWIEEWLKDEAQSLGYTVVEPSLFIATHLSRLIEGNIDKLLGYNETEALLEKLSKHSPKLVKELTPNLLSTSKINEVLKLLLSEGVPLTDFKGIVESLIHAAPKGNEVIELLKEVRLSLSALISQSLADGENDLSVVTIKPSLERKLNDLLLNVADPQLQQGSAETVQQAIYDYLKRNNLTNASLVLAVQPQFRQLLARFVRTISSKIHVLSFNEIPDTRRLKIIGTIG